MAKEDQAYALDRFVLMMLSPRPEGGFLFQPRAEEALLKAIEGLFESGLDPKQPLEDLMRIAYVLKEKESSPEVTESILETIAKSDDALKVLGIESTENVKALKKQFAQFTGENTDLRAAKLGEAAPEGSLKASSFQTPLGSSGSIRKPLLQKKEDQNPANTSAGPSTGTQRRKFKLPGQD